jgi:hypothetical protein
LRAVVPAPIRAVVDLSAPDAFQRVLEAIGAG